MSTPFRVVLVGCGGISEAWLKPLADSMANARKLVKAAAKARRVHAVMQNRRYLPEIRRVRDVVAAGWLGPLTTLTSDFFIGAHFGGFREQMQHVLLPEGLRTTWESAWHGVGTQGSFRWDGYRDLKAQAVKGGGHPFSTVEG